MDISWSELNTAAGVMTSIPKHELDYVAWQNRAYRFYLAARLLHRKELYSPAAYAAAIAIELLQKATLIYWDRSFNLCDAGHAIAKLSRMIENKVPNSKGFAVPAYFHHDERYLTVSRYPTNNDRGVAIPASFLEDLDKLIVDLILKVPFQHNTQLKRTLCGADQSGLLTLRYGNKQMRRLRKALPTSPPPRPETDQ